MARTNIEESAWARISKLASLTGSSYREAVGTVTILWHESQDALKTHATKDELIDWSHLYELAECDAEEWISAMVRSRIVSRTEDGLFLIHGNDHQIDNVVKLTSRSMKGGEVNRLKWEAKKRLLENNDSSIACGYPQAMPEAILKHSAIQCNAIQCNAIHERAELAEPTVAVRSEPAALISIDELNRKPLAKVSVKVQAAWLALYEDRAWLERELRAAIVWCTANPQRAPKSNWSRFFTNWLKRGWEYHRKTIPTQRPGAGIVED